MKHLKLIGDMAEEDAYPILKNEFESVEWVSNSFDHSPYDFKCKDKFGNTFFVDVKSCYSRKITISKKKLDDLIKTNKNFYFMLLSYNKGEEGFYFLRFDEVLNNKFMFKFELRKKDYITIGKKGGGNKMRCPDKECGSKLGYFRINGKQWVCRSCSKITYVGTEEEEKNGIE